jgi:hypothetical protein
MAKPIRYAGPTHLGQSDGRYTKTWSNVATLKGE